MSTTSEETHDDDTQASNAAFTSAVRDTHKHPKGSTPVHVQRLQLLVRIYSCRAGNRGSSTSLHAAD